MSETDSSQPNEDPSEQDAAPAPPPPLWLSYLRLLRAPNVFSAIADIAAGFIFAQGSLEPWPVLATLAAASMCLYMSGMVLNDVYDLEIDRAERPNRPLPSGQIPVGSARTLGFLLLGVGVVLATLAGHVINGPGQAILPWRSGCVALLLAGCIVLYDGWAKQTWFGPVVMGLCRMLNLLLGMSVASALPLDGGLIAGYGADHLLVAGGMGVYIAGVTLYARDEVGESSAFVLGAGAVVMILGIVLVGSWPSFTDDLRRLGGGGGLFGFSAVMVWRLLLTLLCLTNARRCFSSLVDGSPQAIQVAVVQALMSIILYDATIAMAGGGETLAMAVAALVAPAWLLGRWVYST